MNALNLRFVNWAEVCYSKISIKICEINFLLLQIYYRIEKNTSFQYFDKKIRKYYGMSYIENI